MKYRTLLRRDGGAVFRLVKGMRQQRIVCQAIGCGDGQRLWWFVDGVLAGDAPAAEPFAVDMSPGEHAISCAAADGQSAAVSVTVR